MITSKNFFFGTTPKLIFMSGEEKWLNRLNSVLDKHIDNSYLDNEQIAQALEISERHLFRKVKALTGQPPQKYLRLYRINRALQYMKNGKFRTVKETAYAVGFKNPSYFIRQFEKACGKKPLQVLQESGWR